MGRGLFQSRSRCQLPKCWVLAPLARSMAVNFKEFMACVGDTAGGSGGCSYHGMPQQLGRPTGRPRQERDDL